MSARSPLNMPLPGIPGIPGAAGQNDTAGMSDQEAAMFKTVRGELWGQYDSGLSKSVDASSYGELSSEDHHLWRHGICVGWRFRSFYELRMYQHRRRISVTIKLNLCIR